MILSQTVFADCVLIIYFLLLNVEYDVALSTASSCLYISHVLSWCLMCGYDCVFFLIAFCCCAEYGEYYVDLGFSFSLFVD